MNEEQEKRVEKLRNTLSSSTPVTHHDVYFLLGCLDELRGKFCAQCAVKGESIKNLKDWRSGDEEALRIKDARIRSLEDDRTDQELKISDLKAELERVNDMCRRANERWEVSHQENLESKAENTRLAAEVEWYKKHTTPWKSEEEFAALEDELRIAKTFTEVVPEIAQLKEELVRTMRDRSILKLEKEASRQVRDSLKLEIDDLEARIKVLKEALKRCLDGGCYEGDKGTPCGMCDDVGRAALESEEGK